MLGSTYGLCGILIAYRSYQGCRCNEDKGDKVRGKKINVGNTLEDNLKKNDKFDWQFVSREKDHEIKMGKYMLAYTYLKNSRIKLLAH